MPIESQQNPQENKERESAQQTERPPLPGGSIPRHLLWNMRVNFKTRTEAGVTTPEGRYIPFGNDEHFAIIKDRERGIYQAVKRNKDGSILEDGLHLALLTQEC